MKKIIVIGCPESGKSTFSKALAQKTGIPLFHLDLLYWNADKTTVTKEVFMDRLNGVLNKDRWIIDGNYGSTLERRLNACDTVFFLDYPLEVCLDGIRSRKGKPRSDTPWIETSDEMDEEFLHFIENYDRQSKPKILHLLEQYSGKDIVIFKNRKESEDYLSRM